MLPIGSSLGAYEILDRLGAGGMGEVYRARDRRLGREVALKVLPTGSTTDRRRLHRFDREAQILSQLNHPNIVTIYEIGETNAGAHIAMELVEGQRLRELLGRRPLPPTRLLEIACQVASGLAAAHAAGIVHRDLKPENVIVSGSGVVKILDFGLAKRLPFETGAGLDETLTNDTETGLIVGTAAYMSPEQASGEWVDFRSDQFSFGSMLYEMATGTRAFGRLSKAETLSAIIRDQPPSVDDDISQLPGPFWWIVERCLAKAPDERYASTDDLRRDLTALRDHVPRPVRVGRGTRPLSHAGWAAGALAVCTVALGVVAWRLAAGEFAAPPLLRFEIPTPDKVTFSPAIRFLSLSPDGRRLVFLGYEPDGTVRLWLRQLDAFDAQPLAGTEGARQPIWSPDSRTVAFFSKGTLKAIDVVSGAIRTICDTDGQFSGAWSSTGVILFTPRNGTPLWRVPAAGGTATPASRLYVKTGEAAHLSPRFLPGGKRYLFTVLTTTGGGVYLGSLDSTVHTPVLDLFTDVSYLDPGYLLFRRGSTLFAATFDQASARMTGDPIPIVETLSFNRTTGRSNYSVADTGVLAYRPTPDTRLEWVDRSGRPLRTIGEPGLYRDPELSPDGKRVAVSRLDPVAGTEDIWIIDMVRGVESKLTTDLAAELKPIWSPDGQDVVFASNRTGSFCLYRKHADGSGVAQRVYDSTWDAVPDAWLPDGRAVLLEEPSRRTVTLKMLPADGMHPVYTIPMDPSPYYGAQLSPDGRWILYTSDYSGRDEVYLRAFPAGQRSWQVSAGGGIGPRWRHDQREIFYLAKDGWMMSVALTAASTLTLGESHRLFATDLPRDATQMEGWRYFDVAGNGQRLLLNIPQRPPSIAVISNWLSLLSPR